MRQLIAGNWKMNGLTAQAAAIATPLRQAPMGDAPQLACDLLVCPPFTQLAAVAQALAGSAVAVGGHITGVAQFCFDGPCRSSVSLNMGTFLNNQSNDLLPIYGTAGLTLGVSKLVSLLVEPGFGSVLGSGSFAGDGGSVFFLDYGVRLSGEHFGFDLAFVRPFGTDVDGLIVGFPWVGFTYRTSGSPRTQPPAAVSMAMAR